MKKTLLLGVSALLILACNKKENKEGNLHLTGEIKGLSQGKIYIQQLNDSNVIVLDSIVFKGNSTFDTYLDLKEPEVLYLTLDRGQTNSIDNSLAFFAEPGDIQINSKLKEFYASAKISGSKNQEIWEEFNEINKKFSEENLEIMHKRLLNEMDFNQKTQDSINEAYEKLVKRKYRYTANFAANHADKAIGAYLAVAEIADINISYLEEIEKAMSPEIKDSKYGKMLTEHIKTLKSNQ